MFLTAPTTDSSHSAKLRRKPTVPRGRLTLRMPLKTKYSLGELTHVKVVHTNIGTGSGWLLQNINISDEQKRTWSFPCGHFIDGQDDI